MNIQPVIPMHLNPKLNLIARIIMPVVTQYNITSEGAKQSGLADALVSGFFSPAQSKNGLTWGAGPVFLVPTATDDFLGTKKFGIGPTVVALKQSHGLTYGALVNQIWSIAGDEDRADVSQLFIQPFFTYNWKTGAGIGGNMEITQNWIASTTLAFLNPIINKETKMGKQTISLAVGPRIPISGPEAAKPDFGWRAVLTLVFPN
jgi:hypothetical protein